MTSARLIHIIPSVPLVHFAFTNVYLDEPVKQVIDYLHSRILLR